jgi:hypothetical protein
LPIFYQDTGFVGRTLQQVQAAALAGARVINLSVGPVTSDTLAVSDSILTSAATALDRLLDQLESMSPSYTPLLVIAASNFDWDAKWGGFPRINATHPKRVLVVTSSTASGALYVQAAKGPLVDIAAPGFNVSGIQNGNVVPRIGTSFAAPFVTGIAGLLFSFDPRLTRDSVHDLIINGAVAGNWSTTGAASFPIANAFESLKLAAERPGAPLCGNRVWWSTSGALMTERGSSDETLLSSLSLGDDDHVIVEHDGRKISRCTSYDLPCSPLLVFGSSWAVPAPGSPTYLSTSSAFLSRYGISHDKDSMAFGEQIAPNVHQLYIRSPILPGSDSFALGATIQAPGAHASGLIILWNPTAPELLIGIVRIEVDFTINLDFRRMNRVTGTLGNSILVLNDYELYGASIRDDGTEFLLEVQDASFTCTLRYYDYATGNPSRTINRSDCTNGTKGSFTRRMLASDAN